MLGFWIRVVSIAVAAYFCGCFNGAVIVSKYILRDDVRSHGSGNAGLTNFYRTFGGPLTLVVILCDVLKAVAAIRFGVWMANGYAPAFLGGLWEPYAEYWAGRELSAFWGTCSPVCSTSRGGRAFFPAGPSPL